MMLVGSTLSASMADGFCHYQCRVFYHNQLCIFSEVHTFIWDHELTFSQGNFTGTEFIQKHGIIRMCSMQLNMWLFCTSCYYTAGLYLEAEKQELKSSLLAISDLDWKEKAISNVSQASDPCPTYLIINVLYSCIFFSGSPATVN